LYKIEYIAGMLFLAIESPDDVSGHLGGESRLHQDEEDLLGRSLEKSRGDANIVTDQVLNQILGADQFLRIGLDDRKHAFVYPARQSFLGNATKVCHLGKAQVFQIVRVQIVFQLVFHGVLHRRTSIALPLQL